MTLNVDTQRQRRQLLSLASRVARIHSCSGRLKGENCTIQIKQYKQGMWGLLRSPLTIVTTAHSFAKCRGPHHRGHATAASESEFALLA